MSQTQGDILILTVVYLGNKLPKYVVRNLEYLKNTFLDDEIYFISDSKKSINKAHDIGVKTWLAPHPEEQWKEVRESLNHPMGFRDGFWFKTLARIFVLDSFMQLHPGIPTLQIEADVFIFPNFPLSIFKRLDAEIAFPMESYRMGIASLLFLKDHKASAMLVEFALNEINNNGQITDMSLLGKVAHSNKLNFLALPTLPRELRNALNEPESVNLVCNDSLNVSGVFDGISVGQYLLGIDPRNSRGSLILHRAQTTHAINSDKLKFELDSNGYLIMVGANANPFIYNLHNHAKDLRLYDLYLRKSLLEKRVDSTHRGEHREFVFRIFAFSITKAIARKVSHGIRRTKI